MKLKYIIAVHSKESKIFYGAYDGGPFGSGCPIMSPNLSYLKEFDSVEKAKEWVTNYWKLLGLDSEKYNINTLCICEKRFVPVSYYKWWYKINTCEERYIISVYDKDYKEEFYVANDTGFNSSDLPVMSRFIDNACTFTNIKNAKKFLQIYWGLLGLNSTKYKLETMCIYKKCYVPVEHYIP